MSKLLNNFDGAVQENACRPLALTCHHAIYQPKELMAVVISTCFIDSDYPKHCTVNTEKTFLEQLTHVLVAANLEDCEV